LKNEQAFLAGGARRGTKLIYKGNSSLPFKREKILYTRNSMKNRRKANSVALKRSGPLDRAKADPTAKIKSQYRLSGGERGMGLYTYI